jgi:chromosome segregation ATPase
LTRPGSFQDFSAKFGELAATYSRSLAEAAALEAGTLKNAEIDDSGDYVSGSYVPVGAGQIGTERGLAGLQRDRAVAEAELDRLKEALVSAEADIKTSEELRRHLDATVARDRERAQRIKDSVGPLLDELKKTVAEAETVESKAVQKLNGAIKASAAAMNIANDAVNQARQSVSELSPKAQAAAAESLAQNDSWVAAQRGAQKADAQILLGKVYYQQFRDAARDQKLLSEIGAPLRLSDVDAGAYAQKRDTAKRLGTEVLEDAIKQLENSWRALKEHWTVRAEIAGATHLLSLFGDPDGVLRDTALANYQSAVEGREDNPHAAAYVERIRQLRR